MKQHAPTRLMQRVLVTGAAGAVGPAVVRALIARGIGVRAFVRKEGDRRILPPVVDVHVGDLTEPAAVEAAVTGVDGVVHLAGLLHLVGAPADQADRSWAINVEVTRQLVTAALSHDVARFVLASTIAVYPAGAVGPVSEDTPAAPTTPYGRTKLAAEDIVLGARRTNGSSPGTVLRFAAVYGPRVKGNYRRLVQALAAGRFVPIGRGDNHRSLIYVDDAADATVLALTHPAAGGRVFNVCDPESYAVRDIIHAICLALGRRPPRFAVPAAAARCGAALVEAAARAGGWRGPLDRQAVEKYLEHVVVGGRLIEQVLGFRAGTGLQAGWRETILAMRASGELPVSQQRPVA
jgi:nucleoside-diphosphate-sugar epimerase